MVGDDRAPVTPREAYDGHYWKERAERARRMAGRHDQPHIRDHFMKIAAGYDKLAQRAYQLQSEIEEGSAV